MAELLGAFKKNGGNHSDYEQDHPEKIHNGNHFRRKGSSSNQPFCHRIFSELCKGGKHGQILTETNCGAGRFVYVTSYKDVF